ncbi:MAG TPA: hypothetical protein VGN30_11020 [Steroidobacteraceae bacterium]|jgi:hypothetical protein
MTNRDTVGDAAANLLERRWFAAFKAASGVRAECEALLESMAITQAAWSQARVRLSELEALRDALGEELEALDEAEMIPADVSGEIMSAA